MPDKKKSVCMCVWDGGEQINWNSTVLMDSFYDYIYSNQHFSAKNQWIIPKEFFFSEYSSSGATHTHAQTHTRTHTF